jgi:hypothetical protein
MNGLAIQTLEVTTIAALMSGLIQSVVNLAALNSPNFEETPGLFD